MTRTDATGERVKELEAENQSLKFEKDVRDNLNNQLRKQIREDTNLFTEKLTGMARLAESFKTR